MTDLPRLYLHIGYYKTGTSSLQYSMGLNRELLARHGICYPTNTADKPHKHSTLAAELRRLTRGKTEAAAVASLLEHYANEVRQAGCSIAVLSAEGLCDQAPVAIDALSGLKAHFDVTVVATVRRQDNFLQSWYQQLIKEHRYAKTFPEFVQEEDWSHIHYHKALQNWARAFGEENVTVLSFDQANRTEGRIHGALVAAMTEGRLPSGLEEVDANRPYPSVIIELMRRMLGADDLPGSSKDYLDALRRVRNKVGDDLTHPVFHKIYLTKAMRLEILDRFADDNTRLAQDYFGGATPFPGFDHLTLQASDEGGNGSFSEADVALAALELLRVQNRLLDKHKRRLRAMRSGAGASPD